jgi:hypothetical protein
MLNYALLGPEAAVLARQAGIGPVVTAFVRDNTRQGCDLPRCAALHCNLPLGRYHKPLLLIAAGVVAFVFIICEIPAGPPLYCRCLQESVSAFDVGRPFEGAAAAWAL